MNKFFPTSTITGLLVGTVFAGLNFLRFFCSESTSILCAFPEAFAYYSPVWWLYATINFSLGPFIALALTIVIFGFLGAIVGKILGFFSESRLFKYVLWIVLILIVLLYVGATIQRTSKELGSSNRIQIQANKEWEILQSVLSGNSTEMVCSDGDLAKNTCYIMAALKYENPETCFKLSYAAESQAGSELCRNLAEEARNNQLSRDSCDKDKLSGENKLKGPNKHQDCYFNLGIYFQDKSICAKSFQEHGCERYIQ